MGGLRQGKHRPYNEDESLCRCPAVAFRTGTACSQMTRPTTLPGTEAQITPRALDGMHGTVAFLGTETM